MSPNSRYRRFAAATLALSALVSCASAQLLRGPKNETEYVEQMRSGLAKVNEALDGKPLHPIEFSANLFFAHEALIPYVDAEVLTRKVDALAAMGMKRVDINMGLYPWLGDDKDGIEKYDAVVERIRRKGMKLVLNPQYTAAKHKVKSFADWKPKALEVYKEIAARYKPHTFVVIHEPTTMAKRMGSRVSPNEWQKFARDAAIAVKKASPGTRIGAGGLGIEFAYYRKFLELDEIEVMTLDIYSLAGLKTYNRMITLAKNAGKPVYIEETWRTPYYRRKPNQTLETISATGIGREDFRDLDREWLRTLARYASVWDLEAITPFWTQTFFYYSGDSKKGDALSNEYNTATMEAIKKGRRTETYKAVRDLIREYGRKR